jgi:hypothetical protein
MPSAVIKGIEDDMAILNGIARPQLRTKIKL